MPEKKTVKSIRDELYKINVEKEKIKQDFESRKQSLLDNLNEKQQSTDNDEFLPNEMKEQIKQQRSKNCSSMIDNIIKELNDELNKIDREKRPTPEEEEIFNELEEQIKRNREKIEDLYTEKEQKKADLKRQKEENRFQIEEKKSQIEILKQELSQLESEEKELDKTEKEIDKWFDKKKSDLISDIYKIESSDIFEYKRFRNIEEIKKDMEKSWFDQKSIKKVIRILSKLKPTWQGILQIEIPLKHIEGRDLNENLDKKEELINIIWRHWFAIIKPIEMKKFIPDAKNKESTRPHKTTSNSTEWLKKQHNEILLNKAAIEIQNWNIEWGLELCLNIFINYNYSIRNKENIINQFKSCMDYWYQNLPNEILKITRELINNHLSIENRNNENIKNFNFFKININWAINWSALNPRILLNKKSDNSFEIIGFYPHHIYTKILCGDVVNFDRIEKNRRNVKW